MFSNVIIIMLLFYIRERYKNRNQACLIARLTVYPIVLHYINIVFKIFLLIQILFNIHFIIILKQMYINFFFFFFFFFFNFYLLYLR